MLRKDEILESLTARKEDFFNEFRVTKIGIFGSYTTNRQSKESDIDIIEFAPSAEHLYEKKNKIRFILSNRFNTEIDLCLEKYIKPFFKSQILNSAIFV